MAQLDRLAVRRSSPVPRPCRARTAAAHGTHVDLQVRRPTGGGLSYTFLVGRWLGLAHGRPKRGEEHVWQRGGGRRRHETMGTGVGGAAMALGLPAGAMCRARARATPRRGRRVPGAPPDPQTALATPTRQAPVVAKAPRAPHRGGAPTPGRLMSGRPRPGRRAGARPRQAAPQDALPRTGASDRRRPHDVLAWTPVTAVTSALAGAPRRGAGPSAGVVASSSA